MSNQEVQIPKEYQDQLRAVGTVDRRSDAEVLRTLEEHIPVTDEKNIWAFWHSGLPDAPAWCQRNVASWIRINARDGWTVRCLNTITGSPNHWSKFIPEDMLPPAFVKGTMEGPYSGPHSADFLRGALLYLHGGVNIDVGCILIRSLDRICWKKLEDPAGPFNVAIPWMYGQYIANHFVAARRGDPFIKRWHELFIHLWSTPPSRTSHLGLLDNPLAQIDHQLSFDESRASNFHWDFKVPAATVMEYITQVLCWLRLCALSAPGREHGGFDCARYWENNILLFDVLQENWSAEATVGFSGTRLLELLSMRREPAARPGDGDYAEAQRLVWRLLTRSSMQKITHGKGLTETPALGMLWELPENEGKDCEPGTFAELLRYGAEHFQQTREEIEYVKAPKVEKSIDKTVLEV